MGSAEMSNLMINCTIFGNHDDENGNPLPKPRMTQSSKWGKDERANRYFDYARWLRDQFRLKGKIVDRDPGTVTEDINEFTKRFDKGREYLRVISNRLKLNRPPFTSSKSESWECKIWMAFKSNRRGDTDNIIKAVKDILFAEDKYVYFQLQLPIVKFDLKSEDKPYIRLEMKRIVG